MTKTALPTEPIVNIQQLLSPEFPQVFGSKDYRDEKTILLRTDRILIKSGVEDLFIKLSVEPKNGNGSS